MLDGPLISARFPRGTLIAEVGFFVVGAYYALVWRSVRKSSESPVTPDASFSPVKSSWPELRYLRWGVFVSVVLFMFVGAADAAGDWLDALVGSLMGFCAAGLFAMFGVGFVSLFYLWKELVSQLKRARIRSLFLSFPLAIFWLVLGLAVMVFLGMIVEKIPKLLDQPLRVVLWSLIAVVFYGLWMGRSHAALMLRGLLMVLFSTIVVAAVAFAYWWTIRETTLLLVLFLSALGALNVVFYSGWVRLKALKNNLLEPADPA